MPTDIVDVDAFTSPVTVPADGDPLNSASVVGTAFQRLANRTRNLANRTGEDDGLSEFKYSGAVRERTIMIHPSRGAQGSGWDPGVFGVPPNEGWRYASQANFAQWIFPLGKALPYAALLKSARVMVAPGAMRTGTNRMSIAYFETVINFGALTETYNGPLGEVFDDGTTDRQNIPLTIGSPLFISQAAGGQYVIVVTAGSTAGASSDDIIGLELVFDDEYLSSI